MLPAVVFIDPPHHLIDPLSPPYDRQAHNKVVFNLQGDGPGYFKLQLGPTAPADGGSSSGGSNRVLVVAFGSAPGLPNWGGILAKVAAAAESPEQQ